MTILRRTIALGVYDGGTVALVERRDHLRPDPAAGEARQVIITLRARAIVYATGATERPIVFANNDRPGVMLASAVRSYLNRFAVALGKTAVVVTNNDSAYSHGFRSRPARRRSVTVVDHRRRDRPRRSAPSAKALGIELITGATVIDVLGGKAVKGVDHRPGGRRVRAAAPAQLRSACACPVAGHRPST